MKKVLQIAVTAAMIVAPSASAYQLWNLADEKGEIIDLSGTTNSEKPDKGGALFAYSDADNNGGGSYTDLPKSSMTENVFGPHLGEKQGRILMTTTADYEYSFVGVGFNFLDEDDGTVYDPTVKPNPGGDPTGMTLCYMSQKPMIFEMKIADGAAIGWDTYTAPLAAVSSPTHVQIEWGKLAQQGWATGVEMGWAEYKAKITGIQLKFEGGGKADENTFYLGGLGWYGDKDDCADLLPAEMVLPVLSLSKFNGFSLAQNGRVLHFNGLGQTANVEVINMQGRLVSKSVVGAARNTLNLSSLSSGVYMVRISSDKLNFTQKVMLK